MYYYDDLEDNKEAAQTFFGMNNKSSSTLHYNSVRRFLYFVDCAQSRLSAQDLYLQFLLRRRAYQEPPS